MSDLFCWKESACIFAVEKQFAVTLNRVILLEMISLCHIFKNFRSTRERHKIV